MRVAHRIALAVIFAVVGVFALLQVLADDVVTKHYASLTDARTDQLFERGWLPDILPPSTHNIRTSNDLDLNVSTGEFSFTPLEYNSLASRLTPYKLIPNPFADFEAEVANKRSRGFQASLYVEERSTWVFFCKQQAGYCEYTMWLRRG